MKGAVSFLFMVSLAATACGGGIIHGTPATDGGGDELDAEAPPSDGGLPADATTVGTGIQRRTCQ